MSNLAYEDGSPILVGDRVLHESGRTPAVVEAVAVSALELAAIGVEEPGVMLASPPFGLVYLPAWSLVQDPLKFVARGPLA